MALAEAMVQSYMEAFCKTATNGNVTVNFAWFANRMELFCNKCKQTLTAAKPEDTTVDYAVQEFVKLHLHKVHQEYCQCEQCVTIAKAKVPAKPVTLDFKPVAQQPFTGVEAYQTAMETALTSPAAVVMTNLQAPDPDGYGLTNLPKIKEAPQGNPDKDSAKSLYLASKLKDVQQEYAAKVNDVALANKIKLLQMSSQDQAKVQALKQQAAKQAFEQQAKEVTASDGVYYDKAEVAKLELQLYQFSTKPGLKIVQHQPYVAPQPPAPAPKKEKPLKQAVGRKIR